MSDLNILYLNLIKELSIAILNVKFTDIVISYISPDTIITIENQNLFNKLNLFKEISENENNEINVNIIPFIKKDTDTDKPLIFNLTGNSDIKSIEQFSNFNILSYIDQEAINKLLTFDTEIDNRIIIKERAKLIVSMILKTDVKYALVDSYDFFIPYLDYELKRNNITPLYSYWCNDKFIGLIESF